MSRLAELAHVCRGLELVARALARHVRAELEWRVTTSSVTQSLQSAAGGMVPPTGAADAAAAVTRGIRDTAQRTAAAFSSGSRLRADSEPEPLSDGEEQFELQSMGDSWPQSTAHEAMDAAKPTRQQESKCLSDNKEHASVDCTESLDAADTISSSKSSAPPAMKRSSSPPPPTRPPSPSSGLPPPPPTAAAAAKVRPASVAKARLPASARERKVPASRISRLFSFGGLAAGLGAGALAELGRRTLGRRPAAGGSPHNLALLDSSPLLTEANAERIVSTLCRVRGAALKLGQIISIQDNALINPQLQRIFERVRQSADFMPHWQMERAIRQQLGADWRERVAEFEERPFAAASIGQVHHATLHDGTPVAMKVQYPGVAAGIDSDINNLMSILSVWNILPEGLFIDNLVEVAKRELSWECDYRREAECAARMRQLIGPNDQEFNVPLVCPELSAEQVITMELVSGVPLDQMVDADQETRNRISALLVKLTMKEVFEWRYMQTDPNWSNFLYDQQTGRMSLLDFGACREFSKEFIDHYIRIIRGAAVRDRDQVLHYSEKLGFLTGYESKAMREAHVEAVMILGEAFQSAEPFDFGQQSTTRRIQQLVPVMLTQRLCPPPEETYSLHRKMSGVFLLCARLNARISCKQYFDDVYESYRHGPEPDADELTQRVV